MGRLQTSTDNCWLSYIKPEKSPISTPAPPIGARECAPSKTINAIIDSGNHYLAASYWKSTVKKIVESQGGKIELESQVDKGTTFRFSWLKK